MSDDTREDILVRIFTIMETQASVVTKLRNRGLLQNESRPATVLLDGDEQPRLTADRIKGVASMMAPQIMTLRPELYFLPKEKRPANTAGGVGIGSEANAWRIDILKKIWADADLTTLLGSNGSIVYNGCETDLKSGSAMSGEIKLDFVINYVLRPTA